MRIGSLFSGIGGLELGLERAGCGRVVWQCEADPFARRVLAKHWPGVPIFEDVRTMGVDAPIPPVDIICGGFPCQDISNAGCGEGLDGARSGLFFELARIVRLVRPRYIVFENVSAITVRGGARVLGEIAACGYDGVWDCLPAASVGAPHRRDRWFFVGWLRDTDSAGSQGHGTQHAPGAFGRALQSCGTSPWETQPRVGGTADGIPTGVDRGVMWPTPDSGVFNDGQTFEAYFVRKQRERAKGYNGNGGGTTLAMAARLWPTPTAGAPRPIALWEGDTSRTVLPRKGDNRRNRLKALGNAVVPQVAEVVGRVLMAIDAERA